LLRELQEKDALLAKKDALLAKKDEMPAEKDKLLSQANKLHHSPLGLGMLAPITTPNGLGEKKKMKMKDLILLHRMVSNLSWQAASQPDQLPLMMITSKHRNI
jgi:hypothetical protein